MSQYEDNVEDEHTHSHRRGARAYQKATRPWYRKKRFIIPAALIAITIASSLLTAGNPTPQATSAATGTQTPITDPVDAPPPVTEQDAEAELRFGQTHTSDDGLQLTVAPPKPGNAALGATYCTTVAYVNGTDDPVPFNIFDWKMLDTEGVEGSASFTGGSDMNSGLGSGNLRPGGKKSGQVCFDKQGGGTPVQIFYQGSLFGRPVVWVKG